MTEQQLQRLRTIIDDFQDTLQAFSDALTSYIELLTKRWLSGCSVPQRHGPVNERGHVAL